MLPLFLRRKKNVYLCMGGLAITTLVLTTLNVGSFFLTDDKQSGNQRSYHAQSNNLDSIQRVHTIKLSSVEDASSGSVEYKNQTSKINGQQLYASHHLYVEQCYENVDTQFIPSEQRLKQYEDSDGIFFTKLLHIEDTVTLPLLKGLHKRNSFNLYSNQPNETTQPLKTPFLLFEEPHTNMNRSQNQFTMLSLIDDPYDRYIEWYYTHREQAGTKDKLIATMDLDECIEYHQSHCVGDWRNISSPTMFCRDNKACSMTDIEAIEQAKKYLSTQYFSIGLVQEYSKFVGLLEWALPKYFSGAFELQKELQAELTNQRKHRAYPPIGDATRAFLEQFLKPEVEIYEYVKHRFNELHKYSICASSYRT